MLNITFNPSTACFMLNNEDQMIDYAFVNLFSYENNMLEVGEVSDAITRLLERNEVTKVSFNSMLKTHLENMINEYREYGYFTYSNVIILSDIAIFTADDITNKIINFIDMFSNISSNAGMPVIKELYNQVA